MLETVIHISKKPVEFLVIWLHGLGADGYDFKPFAEQIENHLNANVAFVFPHAPIMPVTINGGMEMRAWYDILNIDLDRKVDEAQIDKSRKNIAELITHFSKEYELNSENIILAGFSQGGVIALHEFFENGLEQNYAGIIALSTYYHKLDSIDNINTQTPIFLAHGTQDPVVNISLAEKLKSRLDENHANLLYKTYPMPHSVHPQEVQDIVAWFNQVFDANK